MDSIGGFPACRLLFERDASLVDTKAPDALHELVRTQRLTDLLVLCHGWNNDMAEAEALYEELARNINEQKRRRVDQEDRIYGLLAVFWPSKKFADADLIAGGAASLGSADEELVREMLDELKGAFDVPAADEKLEEAKRHVRWLETDPSARRDFADLVRQVVQGDRRAEDVDSSERFFTKDGAELIDALSTTGEDVDMPMPDQGGATAGATFAAPFEAEGGAQGLRDVFGGAVSGARNLLNYVTYYQMKERAGLVGARGLNPVISSLRLRFPDLQVHLIGHSFGGRLVTAAAGASAQGVDVVCDTLTLLQAAYSHYGLSSNWDDKGTPGLFHRVAAAPSRVRGPIVVTCTRNDKAVGVAYAIASRVAGQVASALGDENDKYGGMGSNGAQKTANTSHGTLLTADKDYPPFEAGRLYNLKTADLITDHSDVRNKAVANAIVAVIGSVQPVTAAGSR